MARFDPDGGCALANAGHLPPLINGVEAAVENGLPLGLVENTRYAETSLQLSPADRVSLMTDGVVEARTASGELFGFDRAASLANQPAQSIAEAARQFGQEDDITVLTLTVDAA